VLPANRSCIRLQWCVVSAQTNEFVMADRFEAHPVTRLQYAIALERVVEQPYGRAPNQVPAAGGCLGVRGGLALGDADAAGRHAFARGAQARAGEDFFHQAHEGETGDETQGEYLV